MTLIRKKCRIDGCPNLGASKGKTPSGRTEYITICRHHKRAFAEEKRKQRETQ